MTEFNQSSVRFGEDVTESFSRIVYQFIGLTVEEYDAVIERCAVKTNVVNGYPCAVSGAASTGFVAFDVLHKADAPSDEQAVVVCAFVTDVVDAVQAESLVSFDVELVSVTNFFTKV